MTTYNKASLKTFFEQSDVPQGTDYANFIDSYVNIVETTAQTMAGPLVTTEVITPKVSATVGVFTTTLAAAALVATGTTNLLGSLFSTGPATFSAGATFTSASVATKGFEVSNGLIVAGGLSTDAITGTGARFSSDVSALNVHADSTIYAPIFRATNGFYGGVGIVSAAGTAQGTAAILSNIINRGKGVTDGSTTGFAIPSNNAGLTQLIYNDIASANLWPPTGGTINALAGNAAFGMAANTLYTIIHLTASAYAVK